jgi:hypothetical protein
LEAIDSAVEVRPLPRQIGAGSVEFSFGADNAQELAGSIG